MTLGSISLAVRPRFLTWSGVVFVVLLPFLVHAVWAYVETRRLQERFEAIQRSGSPTIALPYRRPTAQAAEAERYYRAAAVLVSDSGADVTIETNNRIRTAIRDGRWSPELLDVVRARLGRNREALAFADRAAALPFDGFLPGTFYNYQAGNLISLVRLCELRAIVRALDGDADAAVDSLHSAARLARAIDAVPPFLGPSAALTFAGLSVVLDRARPSAASLDRLARSLADIDHDDRLREAFVRLRVMILSDLRLGPQSRVLPGPLQTHLVVRSLDALAWLIAESEKPWTTRVNAVNSVGIWPVPDLFWRGNRGRTNLEGYTSSVAEQIKRIRCARLLVAGGKLDLIDPFSGRRLEMVDCHL